MHMHRLVYLPSQFFHMKQILPANETRPQKVQLIRESPTLPEPLDTPFGEIKIPEPEMFMLSRSDNHTDTRIAHVH